MKRIPLTDGKFALVSDCDYVALRHHQWGYMHTRKGGQYARRTVRDKQGIQRLMHDVVARRMGLQGPQVDHRNCDTLDNCRSNLRAATNSQNHANEGVRKNNTSGFKGVSWSAWTGRWMAGIKVNYKRIHLGYFTQKVKAAKAYNQAARKHFGKYARLNKV